MLLLLIDWSVNVAETAKDSVTDSPRTLWRWLQLALSNGEVILVIVLVAIPVAALSFVGSGEAFKQIGRGPLSIEQDFPQRAAGGPSAPISAEVREAEIRQFLEAKSYRRASAARSRSTSTPSSSGSSPTRAPPARSCRRHAARRRGPRAGRGLNARRIRMGREPLDVEAEVERQLTELESLGQ